MTIKFKDKILNFINIYVIRLRILFKKKGWNGINK